jgi:hypothetical protein
MPSENTTGTPNGEFSLMRGTKCLQTIPAIFFTTNFSVPFIKFWKNKQYQLHRVFQSNMVNGDEAK